MWPRLWIIIHCNLTLSNQHHHSTFSDHHFCLTHGFPAHFSLKRWEKAIISLQQQTNRLPIFCLLYFINASHLSGRISLMSVFGDQLGSQIDWSSTTGARVRSIINKAGQWKSGGSEREGWSCYRSPAEVQIGIFSRVWGCSQFLHIVSRWRGAWDGAGTAAHGITLHLCESPRDQTLQAASSLFWTRSSCDTFVDVVSLDAFLERDIIVLDAVG